MAERTKKAIATFILTALIYNILAAPVAEANFWQERSKFTQKMREKSSPEIPRQNRALPARLRFPDTPLLSNAVAGHQGTASPLSPGKYSCAMDQRLPKWFKSIPSNYANLKEIYLPPAWEPSDPIVIHIQDAHDNYEAQTNIAKILESLSEAKTPGSTDSQIIVGIEGARGAFTFTPYRSFPNVRITRELAEYLLKQSFISGAEYAGMTLDLEKGAGSDPIIPEPPVLFWGIEDEDLYLRHVQAFKDSLPLEKEAKEFYQEFARAANMLKTRAFHPALREFDEKMSRYHQGQIEIGEYIKYLDDTSTSRPPEIEKFINALGLEESLNYEQVERERSALVSALAQQLPKSELKNLASAGLTFRLGNVSYGIFYEYLQSLCRAYDVNMSQWPEMRKYLRYVLISEKIRTEELLRELGVLETKKLQSLIKTPDERALIEISQDLVLIGKLINCGLSPEDFGTYQNRKEAILRIRKRLDRFVPVDRQENTTTPSDSPAALLEPFEKFFELAIARNHALVDNLLNKAENKEDPSIKSFQSISDLFPKALKIEKIKETFGEDGKPNAAVLQIRLYDKKGSVSVTAAVSPKAAVSKEGMECPLTEMELLGHSIRLYPGPSSAYDRHVRPLLSKIPSGSFLKHSILDHPDQKSMQRIPRNPHLEANTKLAVLISGGFHTQGITQLLKNKKIAYAVLTPRLGKVEGNGTDYLEIFKRDKTPLEKLFSGERSTLKSQGSVAFPMGEVPPGVPATTCLTVLGQAAGLYQEERLSRAGTADQVRSDVEAKIGAVLDAIHSKPIASRTPSITATAFEGDFAWLKNLPARIVFCVAIPVQELLHIALAKSFKMPVQWDFWSLWSAVDINYSRAPPKQAAVVKSGGLFGNLVIGLFAWAMFEHHPFTSYFIATNLTLFISDIVLSIFLKRGDFWETFQDHLIRLSKSKYVLKITRHLKWAEGGIPTLFGTLLLLGFGDFVLSFTVAELKSSILNVLLMFMGPASYLPIRYLWVRRSFSKDERPFFNAKGWTLKQKIVYIFMLFAGVANQVTYFFALVTMHPVIITFLGSLLPALMFAYGSISFGERRQRERRLTILVAYYVAVIIRTTAGLMGNKIGFDRTGFIWTLLAMAAAYSWLVAPKRLASEKGEGKKFQLLKFLMVYTWMVVITCIVYLYKHQSELEGVLHGFDLHPLKISLIVLGLLGLGSLDIIRPFKDLAIYRKEDLTLVSPTQLASPALYIVLTLFLTLLPLNLHLITQIHFSWVDYSTALLGVIASLSYFFNDDVWNSISKYRRKTKEAFVSVISSRVVRTLSIVALFLVFLWPRTVLAMSSEGHIRPPFTQKLMNVQKEIESGTPRLEPETIPVISGSLLNLGHYNEGMEESKRELTKSLDFIRTADALSVKEFGVINAGIEETFVNPSNMSGTLKRSKFLSRRALTVLNGFLLRYKKSIPRSAEREILNKQFGEFALNLLQQEAIYCKIREAGTQPSIKTRDAVFNDALNFLEAAASMFSSDAKFLRNKDDKEDVKNLWNQYMTNLYVEKLSGDSKTAATAVQINDRIIEQKAVIIPSSKDGAAILAEKMMRNEISLNSHLFLQAGEINPKQFCHELENNPRLKDYLLMNGLNLNLKRFVPAWTIDKNKKPRDIYVEVQNQMRNKRQVEDDIEVDLYMGRLLTSIELIELMDLVKRDHLKLNVRFIISSSIVIGFRSNLYEQIELTGRVIRAFSLSY